MNTIHRKKLTDNFTVLPNALLQDKRLSFKARGILCLMLSLPQNWQTYSSWIQEQGLEGREAVQSALAELEALGYLQRNPEKDDLTGRFLGNVWHWNSEPKIQIPADGKPSDGFPAPTKNTPEKESIKPFPELKNSGSNGEFLALSSEPAGKTKRGRPPKPTDPRHQEAVAMFYEMYQERFSARYGVSAADGKNLKTFLQTFPEVTVSEMRETLSAIWSYEVDKRQFVNNIHRVHTLKDLVTRWNQIIALLKSV